MDEHSKPTEAELARLIRAAVNGDRDAVERLVRAIQRLITGYCHKRLADLGHGVVDDVVQNVYVGVLGRLERLIQTGQPIRPYIFKIAANTVVNAFRDVGKAREYPLDESVGQQPDRAPGPEEVVVRRDAVEEVRRIMAEQLSEREQQLIDLRVLGGLTAAEVGQILGMTEGNVRVAQHRALEKVRAALRSRSEPGHETGSDQA